jgi:hypothetical protein
MSLVEGEVSGVESHLRNVCAGFSDFHAKKFLNDVRDVVERLRRERQADAAKPDGL